MWLWIEDKATESIGSGRAGGYDVAKIKQKQALSIQKHKTDNKFL